MKFPELIRANAFDGEAAAEGRPSREWAPRDVLTEIKVELAKPFEANPLDWQDCRVGWGLVAAVPAGATEKDLRTNADLPQCIRALLAERHDAPVFRYRPDWNRRFSQLRNYAANVDVDIASSEPGTSSGSLPQYLLILGDARAIPWRLQFQLNASRFVGRLPLSGNALENYVAHLRCGWKNSEARFDVPIVWATNHGYPDITELLFNILATPIFDALRNDDNIGKNVLFMQAAKATHSSLTKALECGPGLVVTTSHGLTGPSAQPPGMPATLGLPVDQNHKVASASDLLGAWQPDGAIWYAHACCSAGTSGDGYFKGLTAPDSRLGRTMEDLAGMGEVVSPLPMALLSARKPARAFIGHVEPTFDITLRNSDSGQWFSAPIVSALYDQIYLRHPLGYSLRQLLRHLPGVTTSYLNAQRSFAGDDQSDLMILNYALRGLDLQATVLLGDPTVTIPDPIQTR